MPLSLKGYSNRIAAEGLHQVVFYRLGGLFSSHFLHLHEVHTSSGLSHF